jgi:hypothetical protein
MIQPLRNNELIFIIYLKQIFEFNRQIAIDVESIVLREYVGNCSHLIKNIPIELSIIAVLEYVCEREHFELNQRLIKGIVDFLFPEDVETALMKIARLKQRTSSRFEGTEILVSNSRYLSTPILD